MKNPLIKLDKAKEKKIVDEIMAASTKQTAKYSVKSGGEDIYIVIGPKGEELRVFKKEKECSNPKKSAEEYAKKLSN